MEVKTYATREQAALEAARRLNQLLDAHSHIPVLFLSSGGSSLELVKKIGIFPRNFTVGMADERFSEDPKVNNFAQLCGTSFFQKAEEKGAYFIDTRVQPGEDLELFSKRYEDALRMWKNTHGEGKVIITQGVGADGHTLGIMPHAKEKEAFQELFEGENWVAGYDAKDKNEFPLRATITPPFLRAVDHSVAFMAGEEKKQALEQMLAEQGSLHETPARIVHEMKEVALYTNL